ncbi:MAG: FHA domain-containing protein [Gammaproteobacteria bacterium]
MSRQHCQIWFDAERGLLYFRNLSANGTVVNGERLGEGEKGSIERISAFDMVLGRLRLWVELEATGRNG